MLGIVKKMLSRFVNSDYEGVHQEDSIHGNENQEEILQEDFVEVELKEGTITAEDSYSEALRKLIGDGYDLVTLHADAIGEKEIIGDDQELRTEIIIRYNIESSGL
ncbi:MAG: hypothetical protein J0L79_01405 [Rickettsiales bacterium]|nr:hypothetical protein [Rickettsiales bacterium]